MSRARTRLCRAGYFLLALVLLLGGSFLIRCAAAFGAELFTCQAYAQTTACARRYQAGLDYFLSAMSRSENTRWQSPDGRDTVYYSMAMYYESMQFCISFTYPDRTVSYTNLPGPEYQQALTRDDAPYFFYYSTSPGDSGLSAQYHTNIEKLDGSYTPAPNVYGEDGAAHYAIYSLLPYLFPDEAMAREERLFSTFRAAGIPLCALWLLAAAGAALLFRRLLEDECSRRQASQRTFLFLLPPFFYWEQELMCLALALAAAALLPCCRYIPPLALAASAAGCALVAAAFLLRAACSLRLWRAQGRGLRRHLFLLELFRHLRGLLPFLVGVPALIWINLMGVVSGLPLWITAPANVLVGLFLAVRLLSLLSLKAKIQRMSQGYFQDAAALPTPYPAIDAGLENIRQNFVQAAQEQLKSERLKAELITNVSHDLKTPLTSVINYIQLLKKKLPPDGSYQGYLGVLENKALQLKGLTEDLLELSRLSSGNETAILERRDFAEIVRQANGEFGERMESKALVVKSELPAEPVYALIDGRKMWRVLENLYGNVVKYALEGTRVYVALRQEGGLLLFSIRNISQEELNIPPEELMERFVRGDRSRHTEGNGLGLSIAKFLVELQGGSFKLEILGDLFTASLNLPVADAPPPENPLQRSPF